MIFPSCCTVLWKHGSDIIYLAFFRLRFHPLFWFQYFLKWVVWECTHLPPDMLQLKPKLKGVLGRLGGWERHGVTESRTILWEVSGSLGMILLPRSSSLPFSIPFLLSSFLFLFLSLRYLYILVHSTLLFVPFYFVLIFSILGSHSNPNPNVGYMLMSLI